MPASAFHYGGQAVIEGVMIRGRHHAGLAVRLADGTVSLHSEALDSPLYRSPFARVPFARGLIMLWDTLVLGTRMMMRSANLSLASKAEPEDEPVEIGGAAMWGTMAFTLLVTVAVFFLGPMFVVNWADRFIASSLVSNLLEGGIRLAVFIGYIAFIGLVPDIRRVFSYHGAEHKAVNAYEDGCPLEVGQVARYSTAHNRCGTAFLLVVFVISILVFALLGRPPLWLRTASRVLLIPAIAAIGYELIRLGASHAANAAVRLALRPALTLQALTTREPSREQVEVAIAALEHTLALDSQDSALDTPRFRRRATRGSRKESDKAL